MPAYFPRLRSFIKVGRFFQHAPTGSPVCRSSIIRLKTNASFFSTESVLSPTGGKPTDTSTSRNSPLESYPKDAIRIPDLTEQVILHEMVQTFLRQKDCPDFRNIAVIGNQHVTGPTIGFLRALRGAGINPQAIGLIPKIYSMSPEAAQLAEEEGYQLWAPTASEKPGTLAQCHQKDISKDIMLFKEIIKNIGIKKVIGLGCGDQWTRRELERVMPGYAKAYGELTTSGLYDTSYKPLHPIVDFANSALKKILEPYVLKILIAKKINEIRVFYRLDGDTTTVGIIGNGAVGAATTLHLLANGLNVIVYDDNDMAFAGIENSKFARVDSKEALVEHSQLIIDCTGKNPLHGLDLRALVKHKTLFTSFSSGEDGFLDIVTEMGKKSILSVHPLSDYVCHSKNGSEMVFIYGGKPSTFSDDLVGHYGLRYLKPKFAPVPFLHYEGIACGLFGTFIQSVLNAKTLIRDGVTKNSPPPIQQFDPYCQQWIAMRWGANMVKLGIVPEAEIQKFEDIDWIIKHSGKGVVVEHTFLRDCYERGKAMDSIPSFSPH